MVSIMPFAGAAQQTLEVFHLPWFDSHSLSLPCSSLLYCFFVFMHYFEHSCRFHSHSWAVSLYNYWGDSPLCFTIAAHNHSLYQISIITAWVKVLLILSLYPSALMIGDSCLVDCRPILTDARLSIALYENECDKDDYHLVGILSFISGFLDIYHPYQLLI